MNFGRHNNYVTMERCNLPNEIDRIGLNALG